MLLISQQNPTTANEESRVPAAGGEVPGTRPGPAEERLSGKDLPPHGRPAAIGRAWLGRAGAPLVVPPGPPAVRRASAVRRLGRALARVIGGFLRMAPMIGLAMAAAQGGGAPAALLEPCVRKTLFEEDGAEPFR